jgi:hypothetical protein
MCYDTHHFLAITLLHSIRVEKAKISSKIDICIGHILAGKEEVVNEVILKWMGMNAFYAFARNAKPEA